MASLASLVYFVITLLAVSFNSSKLKCCFIRVVSLNLCKSPEIESRLTWLSFLKNLLLLQLIRSSFACDATSEHYSGKFCFE